MKIGSVLIILIVFIYACGSKETLFEEVSSSKSNIHFANNLTESEDFNVLKYGYFYNGGGVASGDFNNDGLSDLYFTGNLTANKLYLNKGNLEFEDITDKAGVAAADGWNTGVSVVDINSDGWLDIYVCRSAAESPMLRQNLLFINNKNLTFSEKAAEYGLNDPAYSTQASFFDFDKDGDLDVFLLNHSIQQYAGYSRMLAQYKKEENLAFSSRLMRNDAGKFIDISKEAGLNSNVLSFGLGIATSDFNNDGWLDLYVSNDYNEEDYLYLNQKNGTFKETIRETMGHTSLFSMGSDAADFNNDGWTDLLTLDMQPESNERIKMTSGDDNFDKYSALITSGFHHQSMRNMLQMNNGVNAVSKQVSFSEIGQLAGVSNTDWSWSALFSDFDLDGKKDLFITNGYAKDYTNMEFLKYTVSEQTKAQETGKAPNEMEVISKMPKINEANYIFQNSGEGFENKQIDWGLDEKMMSNGAVYVDLDNDGDLDLVTNNMNEEAKIFKNNAEKFTKNNFINIKLEAKNPSNLIGAKVWVYAGKTFQIQEFSPVRGFQSSIYCPLTFGLGSTPKIDSIRVVWQNNKFQTLTNVKINTLINITDTNATQTFNFYNQSINPNYEVSDFDFTHKEDEINDFKIQPLLPQMLSYVGPKIANGDVNNDGIQDFYICGSKGQSGKIYINSSSKFIEKNQPALEVDKNFEDADATFFDADGDKDLDLFVASAGYSLTQTDPLLTPRLYLNNGNGVFTKSEIPYMKVNASCTEHFDFDNDNDEDIFIGGRTQPQSYPLQEKSIILRNNGKGKFEILRDNQLNDLGLITDVSRLSNNSLLVSVEFGKSFILNFTNGKVLKTDISESGLWQSTHVDDFDKDGDKDFIIGNFGKNYQPIKNTDGKLMLFAGDFANNSRIIPILTYQQKNKNYTFAARDELLDQIPSLKSKYTDYLKFSTATFEDIFDKIDLKNITQFEATFFETTYFENKNGNFIPHKLPMMAQNAPIFAIETYDINQDGFKDIILGGNVSKTRVRIGKVDANEIQVYLNDKNGNFKFYNNIGIKGDVRELQVVENQLFVGINNDKVKVVKSK